MADNKPSIILCSGAWHTIFHIKPVVPYFEQAGYRFIPCPLPAAGKKGSTCEENYAAIQKAAEAELANGRKIVIILHSLAGIVGCEAVNQLVATHGNGIQHKIQIIFVGSFMDWIPITEHLMEEKFCRFDPEAGVIYIKNPHDGFYNDMEREAAQPFIDALTFQTPTPIEFSSDAWQSVKMTHLICEKDGAVLPHTQVAMAEQYGMKLARIDAGHCPFISQPEKFVEVVGGILGERSS